MPVPLLLDTDLGTTVDDALALAYAVRHPGIDLRAVTTVSGDAVVRARLASALLQAAGRPDVVVAAGASGFDEQAWSGHEGTGMPVGWEHAPISDQPALDVLLAHDGSVAAIGMLTNVAGALAKGWRPVRLAIMGGLLPPTYLEPARDHNTMTDAASAIAVLTTDLPLLLVPLDVTIRTRLDQPHVERLREGDAFCQLLAGLLDVWVRQARHRLPAGQLAYLHDPLTVAAMVGTDHVVIDTIPITAAIADGLPRTFIDPVGGRLVDVVRYVDAEGFAEHWLEVVLGGAAS